MTDIEKEQNEIIEAIRQLLRDKGYIVWYSEDNNDIMITKGVLESKLLGIEFY